MENEDNFSYRQEKIKTIVIEELNIEVETYVHDKGKKLLDIKIPEGWRLLTIQELIFLHNNKKYRDQLNMENTWEFIEQPLEFNKEKGQVVGFYSSPFGATFYCNRSPIDPIPSMGIRLCRDLNKNN